MTIPKILHILRNPYGVSEEEQREARLMAADMVEDYLRERLRWRLRQQAGVAA